MGGSKGGSADSSGMWQAFASAQAAQQAYALGQQQLQWTQQVWNQEQPMIQQVVSSDVAAQQQQMGFAQQQEDLYQSTYEPLEQQYAAQAQQWASPEQQSLNAAAAESNVNEASESQRQASQEQLESYGINPGSTRFAGLDIGSRTMQAAAAAGAGTSAIQQTKLQGLGLEAGVVNTGRGLPNTSASLTASGVGAGSAATGASQSNLATGSNAMTAPATWYNAGANNMNTYVNAVNGYNQAQLGYAQVGAMQSMGLGSLAGSVLGLLQEGGEVADPSTYDTTQEATAIPPAGNSGAVTRTPGPPPTGYAIPPGGTPGGGVPTEASPSGGQQTDDVPARLTAGEFVMPKDVAMWKGHEYFVKQIDQARAQQEAFRQRGDIGGEQGTAIPQRPTFVSRPSPSQVGMRTGSPGVARQTAIPPRQAA